MEEEKKQITAISMALFVPIYFAIVGYTINIPGAFRADLFLGFLMFSTIVEGLCVFMAMRGFCFGNLTSLNFAVAMNTRGGPGIVLASVTYSLDLIDEQFFVALVLTAIVTSLLSGIWFNYLVRTNRPLIDET